MIQYMNQKSQGLVELINKIGDKIPTRTDTQETVKPGKSMGILSIDLTKYDSNWLNMPLSIVEHAYRTFANQTRTNSICQFPSYFMRVDEGYEEDSMRVEYFLDEGCAE